MAVYYWVGGSGTWDNASSANWSASSGGAGGAGVPNNVDTVNFDSNSGTAATVTVTATAASLSTVVNKSDINLSLSGSPTLCTTSGTLTLTSGTITLNNFNLSTGLFSSSNSNVRAIAFGSGSIQLTGTGTVLAMSTATNFSWTGTGGFSRNHTITGTFQVANISGGNSTVGPNLSFLSGSSNIIISTNSYFRNLSFAGSSAVNGICYVAGNLTLSPTGSHTLAVTFNGTTSTITSNGRTLGGNTAINSGTSVTLAGALNCSTFQITVSGTLTTTASNFAITAGTISIPASGVLTLNGSTVTVSSSFINNGTVNAGTSQIIVAASNPTFTGNSKTYYNLEVRGANLVTFTGANTFNNLLFRNPTATNIVLVGFPANQTVNGTFGTTTPGTANRRVFFYSDTFGTQRTITCSAASFTDADFRDIVIAGAAAPASGTRIGNAHNNSGISFPAGVNKYWVRTNGGNWSGSSGACWAATSGGVASLDHFPLVQDTAVFESVGLNSGQTVTIDNAWNIGNVNMSGRTANTMTLATVSNNIPIYGSWVNGTGTTMSGTGLFFFFNRTPITITSAGRTFTQQFSIACTGSSVTLQDALTLSNTSSGLTLNSGTFDAAIYNVTLASNVQGASGTDARTLAVGSGTWTITASGTVWNTGGVGFTATGTGTLSFTNSISAKVFFGGSKSYSGITVNQGGSGALTIYDSNTFADITNTYASVGATSIIFASGATTTLSNFTASGQSGRQLSLSRTSAINPILSKTSGTVSVSFCTITGLTATGGAVWEAFTTNGNTNGGNNVGWLFAPAPLSTGNMFLMFS